MSTRIITSQVKASDGLKVIGSAGKHEIIIDEPRLLGGSDQGMNPLETFLNALGACQAITAKMFAGTFGIKIKDFVVDVQGEIDLQGFRDDQGQRHFGFTKIKTHVTIEADNSPEEIDRFLTFVDQRCPALGTLTASPELDSTWSLKE